MSEVELPPPNRRPELKVLGFVLLAMIVHQLLPTQAAAGAKGLSDGGRLTVAAAVVMGGLWVTEAIPIPATSLMPIAVFPLLGVQTLKDTTVPYSHYLIFLFLGGFLMARGMERWNLHTRIALRTILLLGTTPARLVAGFMVAAAFLSMWISNAATVVMLTPTGVSVIELLRKRLGKERDDPAIQDFSGALLIGLAYAGSIGGMATLIGTPPNALMASFFEKQYGVNITFATWMKAGLPLVLVFLPVAWWLLVRVIFPVDFPEVPGGREEIQKELAELGPMSVAERRVAIVFGCTALAWLGRQWIDSVIFGPLPGSINDASIAMLGSLALFLLPSGGDDAEERLLDWSFASRVPWGVLLLFGGGLSLAAAMTKNGVPVWIGELFRGLEGVSPLVLVMVVTVGIILLTEFTSNTATTASLLPILAGVTDGIGVEPYVLFLPAVFAASCAFMMPVATPPNAIVLASEAITVRQLFRAGIWMNLVGAILITAHVYLVAGPLVGDVLKPPAAAAQGP